MAVKSGYRAKKRGQITRQRKQLFFVVTEGKNKSEKNYLRHLASEKLAVHFIRSAATDPVNMARALIVECSEDNGFDPSLDFGYCIFDTDFADNKNAQIDKAQQLLSTNKKISLVISSPCYEIWYICHYVRSGRQYNSNDEVIAVLKSYMPDYDKALDVFDRLLDMQDTAIENAKGLEQECLNAGRKPHTTDFAPSTEFYKIVQTANKINAMTGKC